MGLRALTPELVARYEASGSWQQRTLLRTVLDQAGRAPDKIALSDGPREYRYADLALASDRLAGWLIEAGMAAGDVVAAQIPSKAELVLLHLACARADLVFLPLSDHFRPHEVAYLLQQAAARILVTDALDHAVAEAMPSIELAGTLQPEGADFAIADVVASGVGSGIELGTDPNAAHLAMVSSGTTALPTVSLWSDNNLWFFLSTFARRVGLTAEDVALQIAPANTGSTGYVFPVLAPLLFGARSILCATWNAARALQELAKHRPTMATAIPTQIIKMMQDPSFDRHLVGGLRVFTNAGAAMAPEWATRTEELFGCRLHSCYGASDGGVPAMTSIDDPREARVASVGKPVEAGGCRVVDAAMQDVAPGEVGEIIWRNATKSLGYLNDPASTEETFWGDGWFRSGDLGRFDPDGYLHIVGRGKDLIIRGGQNIVPAESEDLLAQHPAVVEVAVVGLPDPVYGQRACACVVPAPGRTLELEEVVRYLSDHELATFKLPESLELFNALPYNTGHKVIKQELVAAVMRRHQAHSWTAAR